MRGIHGHACANVDKQGHLQLVSQTEQPYMSEYLKDRLYMIKYLILTNEYV